MQTQPIETATPAASSDTLAGHEPTESAESVLTIEERSERELHERIATAAYYLSQARGFAPGNELDDWLVAELAVEQGLVPTGA